MMPHDPRQLLPSVTRLLHRSDVRSLVEVVGHDVAMSLLSTSITKVRDELALDSANDRDQVEARVLEAFLAAADRVSSQAPRQVINATGILLHTGLGRAPLSDAARSAVHDATGACLLEVNPESGERDYRGFQVAGLLQALTGAEDSLIVNNNAGATLLVLQALCRGGNVVISRGQLVEIGGAFRLPEIFAMAGVSLREVGTTNRTRLDDYERAIDHETVAILRVHASNYRIRGFTSEPTTLELSSLAHEHQLLMFDDIGSGQLTQTAALAGFDEPDFRASLAAGADLVLGSGDKLLGGPQCGIVLGRRHLVEQLKHHPLARCLRIDKLSLAALHATLLEHARQPVAPDLPLYQMLTASVAGLRTRADAIIAQVTSATSASRRASALDVSVSVIDTRSEVGGGTCADQTQASIGLALSTTMTTADALARRLRNHTPSVWGRIENDVIVLDLRSVAPDCDARLAAAIAAVTTDNR